MSLSHQVTTQLDELLARGPGSDLAASLSVGTPVGQLRCDLTAVDALACSFLRLALESDRLNAASPQELKQIGDELARRLNYLLEPIGPVEIDEEGFVLQMRSLPPRQEEAARSYYEILARRGEIVLGRYRKSTGKPRSPLPATVTREVFLRLCEDFTAVLGNQT
jgi:hypothetical protein